MILVYIVCKDKKEAERIGLHVVGKKLAACVNIFPRIESIYRWKGRIVKEKEVVLIVKAVKNSFEKVEKEVKKIHSYTTPCILAIPISRGNKEYLKWLKSQI